jgi:hypothetical protein
MPLARRCFRLEPLERIRRTRPLSSHSKLLRVVQSFFPLGAGGDASGALLPASLHTIVSFKSKDSGHN